MDRYRVRPWGRVPWKCDRCDRRAVYLVAPAKMTIGTEVYRSPENDDVATMFGCATCVEELVNQVFDRTGAAVSVPIRETWLHWAEKHTPAGPIIRWWEPRAGQREP